MLGHAFQANEEFLQLMGTGLHLQFAYGRFLGINDQVDLAVPVDHGVDGHQRVELDHCQIVIQVEGFLG